MSVRRLLLTAAVMAAMAAGLTALAPGPEGISEALRDPQGTVDRAGADVLVLAVAGALAWLCWAWGALGLTLAAASALPGLLGRLADAAVSVVLPAGARRGAALLLGLGLGVAAPVTATALPTLPVAVAAHSGGETAVVPDWPAAPGGPGTTVPDRPDAPPDHPPLPAPGSHVVVRGDCLWSIAESRLAASSAGEPASADVAAAVEAWWTANSDVIGPDPDLLLPGQVLRPPH